jgi:acyl-CoA synthetase (AMP-forming)/AMP-acid ligase II
MEQLYQKIKNHEISDTLFFGDQLKWVVQNIPERESDPAWQKNLKRIYYGGMKFPTGIVKQMIGMFPHTEIFEIWGMTELCGVASILHPEDHWNFKNLTSAGRPCEPSEILILREDGSPAGPGEPGEICIHKSGTTEGYLRDPEKTAETFVGDYLKTGDYGKICDEG